MIVAGVGFRRGCAAGEIIALVERAASLSGVRVGAIAAPTGKCADAGLREAAQRLGLPLRPIATADLAAAQPRCVTNSARALAATGHASIAEGCALAAAGPAATLLLPRIASAAATCALARVQP